MERVQILKAFNNLVPRDL